MRYYVVEMLDANNSTIMSFRLDNWNEVSKIQKLVALFFDEKTALEYCRLKPAHFLVIIPHDEKI